MNITLGCYFMILSVFLYEGYWLQYDEVNWLQYDVYW